MRGVERGRCKMQAGCRRQVMMPTHTPKDRDETAWRGADVVRHGKGHTGGGIGIGGRIFKGVAKVSVAGKISMNFEFIEGRQTGDKVV